MEIMIHTQTINDVELSYNSDDKSLELMNDFRIPEETCDKEPFGS